MNCKNKVSNSPESLLDNCTSVLYFIIRHGANERWSDTYLPDTEMGFDISFTEEKTSVDMDCGYEIEQAKDSTALEEDVPKRVEKSTCHVLSNLDHI